MKIENLITVLEHYRQYGAKNIEITNNQNLWQIKDYLFNKESGNLYFDIKPLENHCEVLDED